MSEINEENKEIQTDPQTEEKAAKSPKTEGSQQNEQTPDEQSQTETQGKKSRAEKKEEKNQKKALAEKDQKISQLQAENATLKEKLDKEKGDYLRLMADVDNIRKKAAEDRLDLIKTASSDLIKGMLPVLDDCEQAIKMLTDTADKASLEGINLIYTKLLSYLKTKGLEQIEALGKPFDTDEHEALTQMPAPSEDMKGKVIDVFQQGYRLGGKIIRFAKVIVGC